MRTPPTRQLLGAAAALLVVSGVVAKVGDLRADRDRERATVYAAAPARSATAAPATATPRTTVEAPSVVLTDVPAAPTPDRTAAPTGAAPPPSPRPTTKPAKPSPTPSGYRLLHVDAAGRAARLNPCAPVNYQFNPAGAPPGAEADVHEAVRRLAAATGLRFTYTGRSDAAPRAGRGAVRGPDGGYPPLLFAWATPAATDLLPTGWSGNDVTIVPTAGGPAIVSATVVLDSTRNGSVVDGFAPGLSRGALLLHELGHAAGLADTDNPSDMMHVAVTEKDVAWSAGDRAGLAAVGAAAGCRPAP